jgi:hypothetical protein
MQRNAGFEMQLQKISETSVESEHLQSATAEEDERTVGLREIQQTRAAFQLRAVF